MSEGIGKMKSKETKNIALYVDEVAILYMTGDFKDIGLKEYIMRKLTRTYKAQQFWAVNGVSFTLDKGDMLGIVGG